MSRKQDGRNYADGVEQKRSAEFPYPGSCGDSEASNSLAPSSRPNNDSGESANLRRQITELQLKLQKANTRLEEQDSELVFAEDKNDKLARDLKVKCVTVTSLTNKNA